LQRGFKTLIKIFLFSFMFLSPFLTAQEEIIRPDSVILFDSKKIQEAIDLKTRRLRARLRIIEFIKHDESDSLEGFIRHCDYSVFKSINWLSNPERFFIEFYKENISFLIDKENSKKFLGLRDADVHYDYYLPELLFHEPKIYNITGSLPEINVLDFLLVEFRNKFKDLKQKYPQHNYAWDFFDFIYNKNLKTADDFNNKSTEYSQKHPDSPFLNIVRYNFIYKKALSKRGIMFGLGFGFYDYDGKSRNFFEERGNFIMYCDTYWSGISLSFSFGIFTFESGSDIFYDNKLMPAGTNFDHKVYALSTGYFFKLHRVLYMNPYLGLTYSEVNTTSYEVKENSLDVGLPRVYGLGIGLKTDYLLHNFIETEVVPEGNIMLRCDIGLLFNNYNHLRNDLGKLSYQINLGILVAMFRPDYEYDF